MSESRIPQDPKQSITRPLPATGIERPGTEQGSKPEQTLPDWRTRINEQRGIEPGQDWRAKVLQERGLQQPLPDWRTRIFHERQNTKPDQGPSRQRWLPQEQEPDLTKQSTRPSHKHSIPAKHLDRGR